MKMTLLDMVQDILSSMDSDEVNNIDDTTEASQVVAIIKNVYFDLVGRMNLSEHYELFELDASGTSTKPTLMTMPSTVHELLWLKYDCIKTGETDKNYQKLGYLPLHEYVDRMHSLKSSDTNVETFSHTVGTSTMDFYYYNDRAPEFYTTFDDYTLIFNAYDSVVDTTLQKNKTMAYGTIIPVFTESNTYTPDLDAHQFQLLFNEAKAMAFSELKQVGHEKAERNVRRNWVHLQKEKRVGDRPDFFRAPKYGRK